MFVTLGILSFLVLETARSAVVLPRPPASLNKKFDSDVYRLLEIQRENANTADLSSLVQAVLNDRKDGPSFKKPTFLVKGGKIAKIYLNFRPKNGFTKKSELAKYLRATEPEIKSSRAVVLNATTEKTRIVTSNELTKQIPAPPSKTAAREPTSHTTPVHRLSIPSSTNRAVDDVETTNLDSYNK